MAPRAKDKKIKILIAEDQILMRDSLRDSLETNERIEVIGETGDGQECIRLAKGRSPDLILMDIRLNNLSGIEALKIIKQERPNTKVLVVSAYDDDQHVLEAFRAGADGFQSKNTSIPDTLQNIYKIMEQGVFVPNQVLSKLLTGIRQLRTDHRPDMPILTELTYTEIKILSAFRSGEQRKKVARKLGISDSTVRNHITSICRKLDVGNIMRAVLKAIDLGIISKE